MMNSALGSGWQFPIGLNSQGGIALAQDGEKVRQSIQMILSTAKGERVMRPTFGCDLQTYVFSIVNTSTLTRIQKTVEDALLEWEPRIELLEVVVSAERISEGIVDIALTYRIRTTNVEENMVFPFYLNGGK